MRGSVHISKVILLFAVVLIPKASILAQSNDSQPIWPLIARSHLILTGVLNVPTDSVLTLISSGHDSYLDISVRTREELKGDAPDAFTLRWYFGSDEYSPSPDSMLGADGKNALLFLIKSDDPYAHGYYFAGWPECTVEEPTPQVLENVKEEIAHQKQLLADFDQIVVSHAEPFYWRVGVLIDASTCSITQSLAFSMLEDLGEDAVPAIIMQLDDRRELGYPSITLDNPPDFWEGYRMYGPEKVVDALDAILNQITGQSFGSIQNGGSDRERQEAVNAWRVYLCYQKQDVVKRRGQ